MSKVAETVELNNTHSLNQDKPEVAVDKNVYLCRELQNYLTYHNSVEWVENQKCIYCLLQKI